MKLTNTKLDPSIPDYTYITEAYGRTEHKLDVERFTADLAREMGGTIIPEEEDYDKKSRGKFTIPGNIQIRVWRNYSHKNAQVGLSISETDIPWDLNSAFYGDKYRRPEITISTARPMATLVRDIRRRLIDAAAEPIAARREVAAQRLAIKQSITAAVAALKSRFPLLDVRHKETDNSATEATFYSAAPYIAGRICSDGSVTIDRIASMSADTFAAVLQLMQSAASK